jgi:hypothetical protein
MRVMPDHSLTATQRLSIWQVAIGFDHPHLVRMLDAGRATADGTPLIYAVCEYPDEFLAGVLEGRPLSAAEAREVLRAALDALRFVHERGFVHAAADPTHIMAFGDRIKLPSDTIERPDTCMSPAEPGPYDPPEAASGTVSAAGDLWSLGITLHEVLTQHRPNLANDSEFRYLAEPFATILRNCLKPGPEERWTIGDIENFLRPAAPEPRPVEAASPEPLPERAAPAVPARPFPIRWVPAAGVVAAVALSAVLLRKPETPAPAPAPAAVAPAAVEPVAVAPAAAAVQPKETVSRPQPLPEPATPVVARVWRVVAWTYSSREAAEKKARSLNRQSPEWKASVFAPNGNRGPYFVSLGGRMSRAEALELQKRARSRGLPRDTFARNFSQ